MPLNPKQKSFVTEYLVDQNATQAAIRAGYSESTARQIGSRLLTVVDIRNEIEKGLGKKLERTQKRMEKFEVSKERLMQELATIALANMNDYVVVNERGTVIVIPTDERPRRMGRAIKKITESTTLNGGSIGLELYDKAKAIELLAKMGGHIVERSEVSGPNGKPVQLQAIRPDMTDEEVEKRIKELEDKFKS